ncbi:hypothetical protein [Flavobacterium silvaticum]|uniref:Lipoprotein n=1 Tax=Flavobacterium silvaticum TaxID=1852020 RepID=A0A972JEZ9_9FLAO|nr:hypothetical protein [Flavobacterium silvaticum]NMH27434.1 hypothetical protein [Flavobacterium silvaticum]
MRTFIYNISVPLLLLVSCARNDTQTEHTDKISKPVVSDYKSYYTDYIMGEPIETQKILKPLHIQKISYPQKTTFIYKYEAEIIKADSLIQFKDSIKFNKIKIKFLDKRLISFGDRKLEVRKYNCIPKHGGYSLNLFITDSLGIIMFQ